MSSTSKAALGRLPGEPKKRMKPSGYLVSPSAPLGSVATVQSLSSDAAKTLAGNSSWPVCIDVSAPYFNLEDDSFLLNYGNVIKVIDLSSNSLMELSNLRHFSRLEELYAEKNVIKTIRCDGLSSLIILDLKHNNIEELPYMADLKHIQNIDLSHNKVSSGFDSLADCKTLKVIDLSFNKISMGLAYFHQLVIEPLKKLKNLEYLAFEGNPIETDIPEFRAYIAQELPKLRYLDWIPVSREERQKGATLDKQNKWADKNNRITRTMKQAPPPQPISGLSTHDNSIESLLADIDDMMGTPTTKYIPDAEEPGSPTGGTRQMSLASKRALEAASTASAGPPKYPQSPLASGSDIPPPPPPAATAADIPPPPPVADIPPPPATDIPPPPMPVPHQLLASPKSSSAVDIPPPPAPSSSSNHSLPPAISLSSMRSRTDSKPPSFKAPSTPGSGSASGSRSGSCSSPMPIQDVDEYGSPVVCSVGQMPMPPGTRSPSINHLMSQRTKSGSIPPGFKAPAPPSNANPGKSQLKQGSMSQSHRVPLSRSNTTSGSLSGSRSGSASPGTGHKKDRLSVTSDLVESLWDVLNSDTPKDSDASGSNSDSLTREQSENSLTEVSPPPPSVPPPDVPPPLPSTPPPPLPDVPPPDVPLPSNIPEQVSLDDVDKIMNMIDVNDVPPPKKDDANEFGLDEALDVIRQTNDELKNEPPKSSEIVTSASSGKSIDELMETLMTSSYTYEYSKLNSSIRLGEGFLGETSSVIDPRNVRLVMKIIIPQRKDEDFIKEFWDEVTRLHELATHKNKVNLVGGTFVDVMTYLTEYVTGPNVKDYLMRMDKGSGIGERLGFARNICQGIKFLHDNGVIHGSLKPSDCILTAEKVPKIRDYGFVSIKQRCYRAGIIPEPKYVAPELFQDNFLHIGPPQDVYSLGILIREVFESYYGSQISAIDDSILNGSSCPTRSRSFSSVMPFYETPKGISDIVLCCTQYAPEMRTTIEQVIELLSVDDAELLSESPSGRITPEREEKLSLVCERLATMFSSDNNPVLVDKALDGVASLGRDKDNLPAILKNRLEQQFVKCLTRPVDNNTLEKSMRVIADLVTKNDNDKPSEKKEKNAIAEALVRELTYEGVGSLFQHAAYPLVCRSAMRLVATLAEHTEACRLLFSFGGPQKLVSLLRSPDDVVVSNVIWACASMLEIPEAPEMFASLGLIPVLQTLEMRDNQAIKLNLFKCYSILLAFPGTCSHLLSQGVDGIFLHSLSSSKGMLRREIVHGIARFTKNRDAAVSIIVTKLGVWIPHLMQILKQPPESIYSQVEAPVLRDTFTILRNICVNEDIVRKLNSNGFTTAISSFVIRPVRSPFESTEHKTAEVEGLLLLRDMVSKSDAVFQALSSPGNLLSICDICALNGGISSIQAATCLLMKSLIDKNPINAYLLSDKNLIPIISRLVLTVDPSKNEEADTKEKAAQSDHNLIAFLKCIASIAHSACASVAGRHSNAPIIEQLCKSNVVSHLLQFFSANFTNLCSVHAIETVREYCIVALLSLAASGPAGSYEIEVHRGAFDLIFAAINTLTVEGKVHVLQVIQTLIAVPGVADAFLVRGCGNILAKLLIGLDIEVQKETEKLLIFFVKNTKEKSYIKTPDLLGALSKTANEAIDPSIKATAAKLLSITSSL